MKTQKALYLKEKKGSFAIGTREIQKPEPGEILVKIKATGLNPADWMIQTLGVVIEDYPAVLGLDIAGDVEEVGEGVTGFVKGERVFLCGTWKNDFGGFQQYTRCPAELAAKIPGAFSYAQMASIPLTFATAAISLFSENGVALNPTFDPSVKYTGQTALVIAGSTSVGQCGIQLLRFAGFSTIITYASGQHTEYLKSLGATHIVDRKLVEITDLPSEVTKITNGKAVQLVHAAISQPETLAAGAAVLADDAPLVTVMPPFMPIPPALEAVEKRGKLFRVFVELHEADRPFGNLIYKNFTRWLEEGIFVPNRIEELPNGLAGVVAGLERMKNNQVSGVKLVVNPQETP